MSLEVWKKNPQALGSPFRRRERGAAWMVVMLGSGTMEVKAAVVRRASARSRLVGHFISVVLVRFLGSLVFCC